MKWSNSVADWKLVKSSQKLMLPPLWAYDLGIVSSKAVTHPTICRAKPCLSSMITWQVFYSRWYRFRTSLQPYLKHHLLHDGHVSYIMDTPPPPILWTHLICDWPTSYILDILSLWWSYLLYDGHPSSKWTDLNPVYHALHTSFMVYTGHTSSVRGTPVIWWTHFSHDGHTSYLMDTPPWWT